jgi:hypothetical protein
MLIENHFKDTKDLLKKVPAEDVASWLLNKGFFPEQYILPPSFQVLSFELKQEPYNKNLSNLTKRQLINISYPNS